MTRDPHEEAALDAALADTFPASDPPSRIVPVTATGPEHGPADHGLDLHRVLPRAEAEHDERGRADIVGNGGS